MFWHPDANKQLSYAAQSRHSALFLNHGIFPWYVMQMFLSVQKLLGVYIMHF